MVPHDAAATRQAAHLSLGALTYRFRLHYGGGVLIIQRYCCCCQNTCITVCALVLLGSILNIKEMMCATMAQIGCLAGEMLCPHRKQCPLNCCRRGGLPAEKGLFCGGRAMSCSHGCLHCPAAAGDQAALPESSPSPAVCCSSWDAWLQNQDHGASAEEIADLNLHPTLSYNIWYPAVRGHRKSPPSWLNFVAKHACP